MRFVPRLVMAATVLVCLATAVSAQDRPQPYRKGDAGITMPVVTKEVHANYPPAAMKAGITGTIEMQAVVLEDGTVGDVTVTKSLDTQYGLDDAAVNALKQWVFKPGTKDEKAVRVLVDVQMSFTLK
jgi:protein TonB